METSYKYNTDSLKNLYRLIKDVNKDVQLLSSNFMRLADSIDRASNSSQNLTSALRPEIFLNIDAGAGKLALTLDLLGGKFNELSNSYTQTSEGIQGLKTAIIQTDSGTSVFVKGTLSDLRSSLGNLETTAKDTETGFTGIISLLADLTTLGMGLKLIFPAIASAATAAFSPGGAVTLAIAGAITMVGMFINEVIKAKEEAKKLEFIKKEKEQGTYWGVIDPKKISKQQLDALKKKSELDPGGTILVDGKAISNLDFYKQNEKLYIEQNTLPYSWPKNQTGEKNNTQKSGFHTGYYKPMVEQYREELNLVRLQENAMDELKTKLEANLGDIGSERDIRLQILETEKEIFRLKYGVKLSTEDLKPKTSEDLQKILENSPGIQRRSGTPFLNQFSGREKWIQQKQEEERIMQDISAYAGDMWGNFQSMLQATGLMKGQFGEIIAFINAFINSISSGVSFFESLIGFIGSLFPGGSAVVGLASGGGGLNIGGMPSGLPRVNIPQRNEIPFIAGQNLTSSMKYQVEMPDVKLKGSDIYLSWRRQKTIQDKRTK